MKKGIGSGFVVALMLFGLPAAAQIIPAVDSTPNGTFIRYPNTYGTQAETAHTIFSQDLNPYLPTITWGSSAYNKYVTNNLGCCLDGVVRLPAGALITAIELEGCDNSTTGALQANLVVCPGPVGNCYGSGFANTGYAAFPGCGFFRYNFPSPFIVDNVANTYFLQVENPNDLTGVVSVRAVRLYYKLQVSTDPLTATFTDVPVGHPFHRFVEALFAAGITGGCGGGNYCPDAPVTRGQMAVFLAGSLGLHWAP